MNNIIPNYLEACNELGISPINIRVDEQWHTAPVINGKKGNSDGRIIFKANGYGTVFNWVLGQKVNFRHSESPVVVTKSQYQPANLDKILKLVEDDVEHGYLTKKQIKANNCYMLLAAKVKEALGYQPRVGQEYQLKGDLLVVPFSKLSGKLSTFQFIDREGKKAFLARAEAKSAAWFYNSIESIKANSESTIIIAEGFATTCSIAEAFENSSEYNFVAAGSISNIYHVAKQLKDEFKNPIIVAADIKTNSKEPDERLQETIQSNLGLKIVYPKFKESSDLTDFNDLAAAEGMVEVKEQIISQLKSKEIKLIIPKAADKKNENEIKLINLANKILNEIVYVQDIQRFIYLPTNEQLTKEQLDDRYLSEYRPLKRNDLKLSTKMIEMALRYEEGVEINNVRYCNTQTYNPTNKGLIEIAEDSKFCLNNWKPSKVIAKDGDCTPFTAHIEYLFNKEEAKIFLDYLAFIVQNQGKKIMWATLIQGSQGIGKSYIGEIMSELLGPHNISNPTNDDLIGVYTDWQRSCQLVIIEELMTRGRRDVANKLKNLITGHFTRINNKFVPSFNYPNRFNFLIFTNHLDALLIDQDDRRYLILTSKAKAQTEVYYDNLFKWSEENLGQILHFLLNRDLKEFNPNKRPPLTTGRAEVIDATYNSFQSWLSEKIKLKQTVFSNDIIAISDITHIAKEEGLGFRSPNEIAAALRVLGSIPLGVHWVGGKIKNPKRLTAIRNLQIWADATTSERIAEYEKPYEFITEVNNNKEVEQDE